MRPIFFSGGGAPWGLNWERKGVYSSRHPIDRPVIGANTCHPTAFDQAIIEKLEAERQNELNALQVARNKLIAERKNLKAERKRLEKERARNRQIKRKRKRDARNNKNPERRLERLEAFKATQRS